MSATTRYDHTAVLTLALDTTTRAGSVAVVRETTVLAVVHGNAARTHGERLPAELDRAVHAAGVALADLDLLAVASGPGAFTGLRIGLAAIQGMAMVLNRPVVAVSALDALALAVMAGTVPANLIAAWMDAARGEVFAAHYHPASVPEAASGVTAQLPTPITVPIVAPPEVALDSIPSGPAVFTGDGAARYAAQIRQRDGAGHVVIAAPAALAPFIAQIGIARAARGEAGPPHALQPLYVRRPDAELARQPHEAR